MPRKVLLVSMSIVGMLLATGALLYASNPKPAVPPISAADAATVGRPWVVKLHAQWCPVCMLTKGVWSQIEQTYSGQVRLVVFDFTDQAATQASRAEAERLGLGDFLAESGFATGPIVVLDGRTKGVLAWISGGRDFAAYSAAIDSALENSGGQN